MQIELENERIDAALWWLRRAFWVLPVYPNTKKLFKGYGIYPEKKKLKTSDMVRFVFCRPGYNLAVTPISLSATILLDFDDEQVYQSWAKACPNYAKSYTERTPSGGYHVALYAVGESVPEGLKLIQGAELKKCFVIAPSVVDGKAYTPGEGEILEANPITALSPLSIPGLPTPHAEANRQASKRTYQDGKIALIKNMLPMLVQFRRDLPTVRLFGQGRWLTARCPFHKAGQEKEPSFWIDSQRNLWGCHACGEHGDVINFYAKTHGVTDREAIRALAEKVGAK